MSACLLSKIFVICTWVGCHWSKLTNHASKFSSCGITSLNDVKKKFSSQVHMCIFCFKSVCCEKCFDLHYMSVGPNWQFWKFIPHPSHCWISATLRLLLKMLCNSEGWSRAQNESLGPYLFGKFEFWYIRPQSWDFWLDPTLH